MVTTMNTLLNAIGDLLYIILALIVLYLLAEHYRLNQILNERDATIRKLTHMMRNDRAYYNEMLRKSDRLNL